MTNCLSTMKKREARKGTLFSSVYIIYALIFWVVPFVWLLILTFSKWNYMGSPKFDGIQNIIYVLQDPLFWKSLFNVFVFLLYFLPLVFITAILFALGLKKIRYCKTFITLSFLLAYFCSGVAYSLVFQKVLAENGPLNIFLFENFGISIPWFTSPSLAMFSVALIVIWKFIGYFGLIFYSGLNAIPNSIYEAAKIDGAGNFKIFLKITLPLINPQIIMVLIFAISTAFGVFTEVYMITGGGPIGSTTTPMLLMYEAAFKNMDPTYAATMSIFIAAVSFGLIKLSRKLIEREVHLT
jgi:multiple sugar transport system permease protein